MARTDAAGRWSCGTPGSFMADDFPPGSAIVSDLPRYAFTRTARMARLPAGTLRATAVKGVWAHSTLAMPLPMHLMVALSYRFGLLSADLTDDGATPKTATRTDQSHLFTAGVGLAW